MFSRRQQVLHPRSRFLFHPRRRRTLSVCSVRLVTLLTSWRLYLPPVRQPTSLLKQKGQRRNWRFLVTDSYDSTNSLLTSSCYLYVLWSISLIAVKKPNRTSNIGSIGTKLNFGESVASVCRYVIVTRRHAFNKPHRPVSTSVAHGC